MHDPETRIPTKARNDHIRRRFHDTQRRELPELIAPARNVEVARSADIDTPHGLTHALEARMRAQEDSVLAVTRSGPLRGGLKAIAELNRDHDNQLGALNRITAITQGFRLPRNACASWRRLCAGPVKLADDLDEHRYPENEVLFPQLEPQA